MKIPREFYKLSELAQIEWMLTEDEILHIAAAGEIRLSVYWSGSYWFGDKTENPPLNQCVFIPSRHARELLADCYLDIDDGIEVSNVTTIDGKEISLVRPPSRKLDENYDDIKNDDIKNRSNTVIPPTFSREKILVMLDEVKRYETLHPDVINREGLSELWRKRPTFQQMTKGKVSDQKVSTHHNHANLTDMTVIGKPPKMITNSTTTTNLNPDLFKQGGRPKSSFTEAIESLYKRFLEEGNTEILKPGKINEFIERLKESTTESNKNFSDYINERILSVKKIPGDWNITTQNRTIKNTKSIEKTEKSRSYKKNDIAKILTNLRK